MKIIDFDAQFFKYAQKWVAAHAGLTEEQVEDSYNQIMEEWIGKPADWLDGATPEHYFDRFDSPQELIALLVGYSQAQINLPEPLYSRIVEKGEACVPLLTELLMDDSREESLRAEVMALLRDADAEGLDEALVRFIVTAREPNELSDMAADILSVGSAGAAASLLDAFDGAPEYAQDLILDVCCNYPGNARVLKLLLYRLKNRPDERGRWAASLQKLGDPEALETLTQMLQLSDLRYLDYIELRDAVEALGGEVGAERDFYGDPDFEALSQL